VRVRQIAQTRQRLFHKCQACGTTFFTERRATTRPPKYCSRRCRNNEFRLRRTLCSGRDKSTKKSVRHSAAYKCRFGDRGSPVEVLGGAYRWHAGIEADLVRFIIDMEMPELVIHPPAPQTATGNIYSEIPNLSIPDDLSIPAFLRRTK
jgi:hypothetical protein